MTWLESLGVSRRLALQTLGAVLGVLLVAGFLLYSERTLIMGERQQAVRQAVEVAHGLVTHFHGQVRPASWPRTMPKRPHSLQ